MYDFTATIDRTRLGSSKWQGMRELNPDVPDGIVPFSVADMELREPPEIIQGLKDYLDNVVLGYAVATPEYDAAVCGWMKKRHGWDIRPEWIVECNGVVPALFTAVNAFTEPGDGVILLTPVYYPFFMAVEKNGRTIVTCDMVVRDGRYRIDFVELEKKAADPKNTLLIFCNPHNPVGRVWERDEIERLGTICLRHGVQVVSDEIHFDLVMPGHKHVVYSTISPEFADNAVVCTAPSKTFNLAGMQTSNIIIQNPELRRRFCHELGKTGFFSCNVLGYKACEIAYSRCEPWLDELLVLLDANRRAVEDFMKTHIPKIIVYPLEGTYLQWWDCRALGLDHKELESFMIRDALLFLDEGYIFGAAGRGFERINLACPTATLIEALERLRTALGKKGLA
ncbi:MAG: pyridoxal phosphate-dependent aminotransferase [Planctomycetes bacterium]|nr:pyridoxal phosphate-dependent aminotransferase [Planctomycetota bacterium]